MYLIVGLGNPGLQYQQTKHNVGFNTIDILSKRINIDINKEKFEGLYGEHNQNGEKVIFLKPQTYMNLSGESVAEFANYFKIPSQNILIIYDDVDIELGKIRIRSKGSSGTHNGMRNIVQELQTENFPRIRIGIGRPPEGEELYNYVLSKFYGEKLELMQKAYEKAADAVEVFLTDGIDMAMNRFN